MSLALRTTLPLLLTLSLQAQVIPPPKPSESALPPAPPTLQLDVTVTGHNSAKPIAGLTQPNFTILDNGAPQPILSFQAIKQPSAEPPIQVFILVDTVNLGLQLVGSVRQRLTEFLKKNGPTLPYPVSFVVLTENSTEIQQVPSTSTAELLKDLDSIQTQIRVLNRSTGIYGAADRIQISLRAIEQFTTAVQNKPGRKLLIWISPGWAYLSGPEIDLSDRDRRLLFREIVNLSGELERARITLYSIDPIGVLDAASSRTTYYEEFLKGVPNPRSVQWANLSLQVLATHTGGEAINSGNDIPAEISRCIDDASAFYVITVPRAKAEQPDTLHTIQIKIPDTTLKPRTQFGYYAQP